MRGMDVRTTEEGGVRIVSPQGPLTLNHVEDFREAAGSGGNGHLIVDLSEVPYMDSSALGALMSLYAISQKNRRGFAVARVPRKILTQFQLTRIDMLVPIFDSVEQAHARLTTSAAGA